MKEMKEAATGVLLVAAIGLAGCAGVQDDAPRPLVVSAPHAASAERRQQECIALAMYWEARGEGRRGMEAVGWTILNRTGSSHFPATPCEVVFEGGERPGCQFSWFCDGRSDQPQDWQSWQRAMHIAGELLGGSRADPTGGALFFHATSIAMPWKRTRVRTAQIGGHVFYR